MNVELQNLENPRETDAFVSALNSLLVGRSPLHLLVSAKTEYPDGSGDYSPYMNLCTKYLGTKDDERDYYGFGEYKCLRSRTEFYGCNPSNELVVNEDVHYIYFRARGFWHPMGTPITAAIDFGNDSITLQYSNRKGQAEKTELMFKENHD